MIKTAWHVDDDQEMIQAISLMLNLLDFESRPFLEARQPAKLLLAGERPDLLILDINMPQVTGMDMLEFIRLRPEFNKIPVIMLSSEDTDIQVAEALQMGADGYVMKPVTLDELEAVIGQAMAKRGPAG